MKIKVQLSYVWSLNPSRKLNRVSNPNIKRALTSLAGASNHSLDNAKAMQCKNKCHMECNVTVPPTPEAYRFHEEMTKGCPSRGSLLAPAWSHLCRAWEMRVTERREEWLVRARAPRTLQILPHVMADLQTRPSANDTKYQFLDDEFSKAKLGKKPPSTDYPRQ